MRVLFVSDAHSSEWALEWIGTKSQSFDALIVGGDLAKGTKRDYGLRFLAAALSGGKPVYFVPGNSDPRDFEPPEGVIALHGKKAVIGEFSIGGLGGSNATPFDTPFEMTDEEAAAVLEELGKVDILVSHCPPRGTKCDKVATGHIGSAPVRSYVESHRPALVLSGHAHEARSVDNLGGTTVLNPGPLMEGNYADVRLGSVVSVELKTEPPGD